MNDPFGLWSHDAVPVPLLGVAVRGEILGRSAKVVVSQRFRNIEKRPLEAVYKFPLPEGAAVCGFQARVGGRVITGEVEERDKAFEIYDKALARGEGGYLLDQERPNVFTMSVGNLNPGAEVLVQVDYIALSDMEGATVRFFLPSTISPRYIPDHMPETDGIPEVERLHSPYAQDVPYGLALSLEVHGAELIRSIESPSHAIRLDLGQDPVRVAFSAESVRMDRDFILYVAYKDSVRSRAYCCRTKGEAFLQLDLMLEDDSLPWAQEAQGQREEREIIFVLDCSGSMAGDSIREAKRALEVCLRGMSPGDWFNVYRFGSTWKRIYDSVRPYSEQALEEVLAVVGKFNANMGGTEILGPLRDIFASSPPAQGRRRDVILLTDGQIGNEQEVADLVRGNQEVTRFFPIGIGAGPNEYLIKALARAGRGAWEFVYPGERIEPKMLRLFGKLRDTEVEQLEVLWDGRNVTQAPSRPAVYLEEVATIFARCDELPRKDAILVRGALRGRKRTWEVPLVEAKSEDTVVPLLWARERIRELEEQVGAAGRGSRQLGRKREHLGEAVIQLSKTFGVLSSLTSFVAVEERSEKDRTTGELVLRKVPVLVTVGWHGLGSLIRYRDAFRPCLVPEAQAAYAPLVEASPLRKPTRMHFLQLPVGATTTERLDILLSILSHQRAEGGLEMDDELAARLGIDMAEIRRIAEEMAVSTEADKLLLLVTAILLKVLETVFARKKDREIWKGPMEKTKDWHRRICREANPRIRGWRLTEWAGWFVNERVRI